MLALMLRLLNMTTGDISKLTEQNVHTQEENHV